MGANELKLNSLRESPERVESAIFEYQRQARRDPSVQTFLESIYWEADRDRAFNRFLAGLEFRTIKKLLGTFGVNENSSVCEVGAGSGFLSWALYKSGYTKIEVSEPNGFFTTGTGYLRSRADSENIRVWNDLDAWYTQAPVYQNIITKNCIHHFQNIPFIAAQMRRKIAPNGLWIAIREFYADTASELYASLASHPMSQKFDIFEWAYPSWHYVDNIEIAGFRLVAAVPAGYANNAMGDYVESEGPPDNQKLTQDIDQILRETPLATVQGFWNEMLKNKFENAGQRFFTRPQMMVFQRIEI